MTWKRSTRKLLLVSLILLGVPSFAGAQVTGAFFQSVPSFSTGDVTSTSCTQFRDAYFPNPEYDPTDFYRMSLPPTIDAMLGIVTITTTTGSATVFCFIGPAPVDPSTPSPIPPPIFYGTPGTWQHDYYESIGEIGTRNRPWFDQPSSSIWHDFFNQISDPFSPLYWD